MREFFEYDKEVVSYLILDFNKPEETERCLLSIKKHSNFEHKIILLSNGGSSKYNYDFYQKKWIDTLIINRKNLGCGLGTMQLFRICDTEYAIYFQNDQILVNTLDQTYIDSCKDLLKKDSGIGSLNLAGDPANGEYTERAHFINVPFYNSIPKTIGGPGPYNDIKYSEQTVQEFFNKNGKRIAVSKPQVVADTGKWSIREIGDGLYKHRCDTKELYILKKPTYKTKVYPPFNDEEWNRVLNNKWIDGSIPEAWKEHSFKVW